MGNWYRVFLRRWLLSLPECASASEHQRGDAIDFVCRELTPGARSMVAFILVWIPITFVSKYLSAVASSYLGLVPWYARYVVEVFTGLLQLSLLAATTTWFCRRRALALLRKRLIWLGLPLCRHCGYDLRGQTEPRCPECGRAFDLALLNRRGDDGTDARQSQWSVSPAGTARVAQRAPPGACLTRSGPRPGFRRRVWPCTSAYPPRSRAC
jgi:hypothetical protein